MRAGRALPLTLLVGVLGMTGCGGARRRHDATVVTQAAVTPATKSERLVKARTLAKRSLVALVTAQTEDRVLVVELPSGRVVRRVTVRGEPDYVATSPGTAGHVAVIVSSAPGE
jgi:hypothetical protein